MQTRVAGVVLFAVVLIAAPLADWHYAVSKGGSDTRSLLYGFGNITLNKGAITQLARAPKPAAHRAAAIEAPVPAEEGAPPSGGGGGGGGGAGSAAAGGPGAAELQEMPAEFAWGKTAASEEAPEPLPLAPAQAGDTSAGEEAAAASAAADVEAAPEPLPLTPAQAPDTSAGEEAAAATAAADVEEAPEPLPLAPAQAPDTSAGEEVAAATAAAEVEALHATAPGPAEALDAVPGEAAAATPAAEVLEAPELPATAPGPAEAPDTVPGEAAAAAPAAEVQEPELPATAPGPAEAPDAIPGEAAAAAPAAEVLEPELPATAPGPSEAPDAIPGEAAAAAPAAEVLEPELLATAPRPAEEAPELPATAPGPAEALPAIAPGPAEAPDAVPGEAAAAAPAAEVQALPAIAPGPAEAPDAVPGEAAAAAPAAEVQEAPAMPATAPGPAEAPDAVAGEAAAAAPAGEVQEPPGRAEPPDAAAGEAAAAAPPGEVQDMPADFAWGKTPAAAAEEVPEEPAAPGTDNDDLKIRGPWDRFLEEKWQDDAGRTRFRLLDSRGPWPGQMRFATALFQDLPESLARSKDCDVVVNTGWRPTERLLRRMGLDQPSNASRVWLLINQEPLSMKEFWSLIPKDVVGKAVMVGNWWNETHAELADERMSSIWLPFGSSYFADLPLTTPLDLQHRKLSRDVGIRGEEIRKLWLRRVGKRRSTVVYQQHTCATNFRLRNAHPTWENYREKFWDLLNQRMKEETQDYGYAAGRCNGNLSLGHANLPGFRPKQPPNITFGNTQNLERFQEGLIKYSWFRFVVALENSINMSGYVSEKLVQALLAGAVPIYAGAAEAPQMFNERSYVPLTPGETENQTAKVVTEALLHEEKYAQLWQEDAASDEQLRRFFSWHPAVWPSHGDSLRRRIVKELDRLCQ